MGSPSLTSTRAAKIKVKVLRNKEYPVFEEEYEWTIDRTTEEDTIVGTVVAEDDDDNVSRNLLLLNEVLIN